MMEALRPKRSYKSHVVASQKTAFFIVTTVEA
jgi:hypothetical protein